MQQAQARYGQQQPGRAAFLRKYLKAGMPENSLEALGLRRSGASANIGGNVGIGLMYDTEYNSLGKPLSTIGVGLTSGYLAGFCLHKLVELHRQRGGIRQHEV